MTMNEELVQLFKEVAGNKKAFPYHFAKLILDEVPRVKPLWKDFISGSRTFQMDRLIRKHGAEFQIMEIHFIEFLRTGPFIAKEIFEIMYLQKHLDVDCLEEKYKYSKEEISFMLDDKLTLNSQDYSKADALYFREKNK